MWPQAAAWAGVIIEALGTAARAIRHVFLFGLAHTYVPQVTLDPAAGKSPNILRRQKSSGASLRRDT